MCQLSGRPPGIYLILAFRGRPTLKTCPRLAHGYIAGNFLFSMVYMIMAAIFLTGGEITLSRQNTKNRFEKGGKHE